MEFEPYDQEADLDWLDEPSSRPVRSAPLVLRQESLNPANGHVRGCVCYHCPDGRDLGPMKLVTEPTRARPVWVDQLIPACILMAMVTICGMILLPEVVPLMAVAVQGLMAVALTIAGVAVCLIALGLLLRRNAPPAQVVERRRGWRRQR